MRCPDQPNHCLWRRSGIAAVLLGAVLATSVLLPGHAVAQDFTPPTALETLERGQQLLQQGSYLAAVEVFNNVRDEFYQEQAVLGVSRAFQAAGQYEQAIAALREHISDEADSPLLATQLAELYVMTGRSGDALTLLRQIVEEQMEPPVRSLVQYGRVLALRGERALAQQQFDAALARYDSGRVFSSDEVGLVALAAWGSGEFHDANALFSEAVRLDANNIEALTWWGDLFQEKFNDEDARVNYTQALDVNARYTPALVGLARISAPERYLTRALDINPRDVAALETFGAMLLRNEREEEGRRFLDQALAVNAESIGALSALAGLAALQDDMSAFAAIEQRLADSQLGRADFYANVAEFLGNNYRFTEAVEYANRAIEADPRNWHGHTVLGSNLVRLGEEDSGREHLEQAFDNDPFNVLTSNMLQVFDVLDGYATLETEHFRVNMSERDALVLWPFMEELLEDSWDRLVSKYQFEPEVPVILQVFERTEDFAVRSVGLPDIGPLVGICFGKVVTLISPDTLSANWQEIVWHELVHVWTLQMTRNRMPRWLSEGISTWEERERRPEWGRRQGLELIRAVQQDRLLPVGDLNAGFTGANSNADLSFAYFQSYLVVEYIVENFGFEKLLELIHEYAEIRPESEMFMNVFALDMDTFDAGFRAWIEQRVEEINVYVHVEDGPDEGEGHGHGRRENNSAVLAELYNSASLKQHMERRVESQPRDFQAHLQLGIVYFRDRDYPNAIEHLETALELLPDYSGYPGPALVLSQVYEALGDREAQLKYLEVMLANQQHDFSSALLLARAALEREDLSTANYYLQRAVAVNPYRADIHRLSAELAQQQGDTERVVNAYEVLLTLDTSDPVDARTNLAQAYLSNQQPADARTTVLRALEVAPGYRRAQEVLLDALERLQE